MKALKISPQFTIAFLIKSGENISFSKILCGILCLCGVSSCLSVYTNLQNYGRHVKRKHYCFLYKVYNILSHKNARRACARFLDKH